MALLPFEEALERLLSNAAAGPAERVPLEEAAGRVLAEAVIATRAQPPFAASAMDGYAVRAQDVAQPGGRLKVIGEAAAGSRFEGTVGANEAVRIFTGAPLPDGAETILIQEDAVVHADGTVEPTEATKGGRHIRRAGIDFEPGARLLEPGRTLDPGAISLAAAAGFADLRVVARPLVALIATGDELVPPGGSPGPEQIFSSNSAGMGALVRHVGARVLDLGIVPDNLEATASAFREALAAGAAIVVTLGGASVGDHDFARQAFTEQGTKLDFWKIAMRPGKPLMYGRHGDTHVLGLPGNPVSCLVCAHLFLVPLIARLSGREYAHDFAPARLGVAVKANGPRLDFMRARVARQDGELVATPFDLQDSSLLSTFAASNALLVRPVGAPAAQAGDPCRVLLLR